MKRFRPLLLCLILCFGWPSSAPQAQGDADILNRERDESATSREERQRVVAVLLEAARTSLNRGDTLKATRFMNRAGRLQLLLSLPQPALETYQQALTTLKQSDPATKIDSLNGMAAAYTYLAKCDPANSFSEQAIALSDQTNNVPGKAEALLILSDCQNRTNHALALRTAKESLALWQSVNHKWGMGKSYSAIGHYQLTLQNLTESTQSHEAALRIWRELGIPHEEAQALMNLGFVEYRKGAWQSVISFLLQAQSLLDEKTHPFEMGQITISLGETFLETGLPEAGLVNFKQATEYFRRTQDPLAMAVVSWRMGHAYYALGNYAEAVAILQQTITDAEKIHEPNLIGMCNEFLGQTYLAMNEPTTALRHFETALDLFTKVSGPMEAARVRARMGQVHQRQKQFEKANAYYQSALGTFRALSDHVNESATLYAIGRLRLDQQDADGAEEYLRQSIDVTEHIRRVPTTSDLTAAFSATIHERYEAYVECLMRKHYADPTRKFDVHAFETSELSRGRSLAELLHTTQTNLAPGLDPQIAQQEKSLRQTLSVKENYKVALLAREYKREELAALEAELAQLDADYKQVNETIRLRYTSYEQMNRPDAWNLRQIQEQVVKDDQTVLLEYSLGSDRSYVWAVTRNDIKSYELPEQARINEAAQKVYQLLATADVAKSGNELSQATRELSQMVFSPVAADLNNRRIIVVADGALHYIPFQILPAAAADQPLVATNEVINALSASILGQLREETSRREAPTKVLAAFGDPVFASNYAQRKETSSKEYVASVRPQEGERWRHALRDIESGEDSLTPAAIQPLFYAKRELANLRDVAGTGTLLVTGFEATREKLASEDLTNYAILHFATHGVLDPKQPENSGLFLSMVNRDGQEQNGFVGLQDIYGLRAPVDLVVLSACRTGLGKDVRGEGLIGLTRGFMYAGASSVIASLWKVDDEATAELMKEFYTNMLQRGMTPASALRAAQNSIRQQPQWRSPYFWAAFTLQGEFSRVIKPAPVGRMSGRRQIILGLSLVLFLAAAAWYLRARTNAKDGYSTVKK